MQNNAKQCKYQEAEFLFSLDGRRFLPVEMPEEDEAEYIEYEVMPEEGPVRILRPAYRYDPEDWRTDVSGFLAETADVIRMGSSALIGMIPSVIRMTFRIASGLGYVIYWTVYGCIILIASVLSAFSIPIFRSSSVMDDGRTDADCHPDVQVNVNVEVNVRR